MASEASYLREVFAGVSLRFKWWGVTKIVTGTHKIEMATEFDADPKLLRFGKSLINTRNPGYQDLTKIKGQTRQCWVTITRPYVEDGIRLIKKGDIVPFKSEMEEYQAQLQSAEQNFADAYAVVLDEAKEKLGKLFDPGDYPQSPLGLFGFEISWPNLNPPEYLKDANPELYEAESKKVQARFEEAFKLGEQMFAQEFHGLVSHLVGKLNPKEDGTKKIFKKSSIENFFTFFDKFKSLNVSSGSQLSKLIDEAKKELSGVGPEDLKIDEGLRQNLKSSMETIGQQLEASMTTAPKRKLNRKGNPEASVVSVKESEPTSVPVNSFESIPA